MAFSVNRSNIALTTNRRDLVVVGNPSLCADARNTPACAPPYVDRADLTDDADCNPPSDDGDDTRRWWHGTTDEGRGEDDDEDDGVRARSGDHRVVVVVDDEVNIVVGSAIGHERRRRCVCV
jgi:hypothetical protein